MRASGVSLLTLILGGFILILLGFSYAVMKRAYADWRDTKAKVKGLRKGFFSVLWTLIKVGTGVLIVVALMVAWVVRDYR